MFNIFYKPKQHPVEALYRELKTMEAIHQRDKYVQGNYWNNLYDFSGNMECSLKEHGMVRFLANHNCSNVRLESFPELHTP